MSKHKILFASSLKPAFDTRIEKLFLSFHDENKYECHFCGVESSGHKNIHSWNYGRGFFFRLWMNIRFFTLLLWIRPQTIFLNNHDLQFSSIVFKSFKKTYLVFDIQENQINNITYQNVYSGVKKSLLLLYTNLANKSLAKHCIGFILAERCYENEINFIKKKPILVLENRAIPSHKSRIKKERNSPIQLLFSGTISLTSGVLNAISWSNEINKISPCELTIIGHTPDKTLDAQLISQSKKNIKINYKGSLTPISHNEIDQAISIADFGLICYELTKANKNKIPTKLYEYLAAQLPIICQDHVTWNDLIAKKQAGVNYSGLKNVEQLQTNFYDNISTNFSLWDDKLLAEWFSKLYMK